MIGVLLVSHGKMADGIKDSVNMIVGDAESFQTLALLPGQDIDSLKNDIFNKSQELNSGDGVVIFVDLYGASPYNASMKCVPQWKEFGMNVRVITGMSLPMVITAVCNRDSATLEALVQEAIEAGQENIQDALTTLQVSTGNAEGDDY